MFGKEFAVMKEVATRRRAITLFGMSRWNLTLNPVYLRPHLGTELGRNDLAKDDITLLEKLLGKFVDSFLGVSLGRFNMFWRDSICPTGISGNFLPVVG